jgi:hypothetical protein
VITVLSKRVASRVVKKMMKLSAAAAGLAGMISRDRIPVARQNFSLKDLELERFIFGLVNLPNPPGIAEFPETNPVGK